MPKKLPPRPPHPVVPHVEMVNMRDGASVLKGVNKLLKDIGLVIKAGGTSRALGGQRYLKLRRRA